MNNSQKINHIAIIPDGNRRWAKAHNLPTFEGHRRGLNAISKLGRLIRKKNIQTFTVWAFSTENWKREKKEVEYLMKIYEEWIDRDLKIALKDQIRIIHLGRKDRLPASLKQKLAEAEKKTSHFTKYYLGVALDYGGRDELLRAVHQVQSSKFKVQSLKESTFETFLDTAQLPQPDPDLIIRTSGEYRTSGFLLWQSAYSEYIFHKKYLPDFTTADLEDCIEEYFHRQRRFGK